MYSNFNIKNDKDLIVFNYHIVQNLRGNLCSLQDSSVAQLLRIDRTKAHRLIKKLEDLQIIKCIQKETCGSVLSTYEYSYATNDEMDNSSNLKGYSVNYETVCEIEDAIRDKIYSLDQYKEDQSKRFKTRNNEISNNNFNEACMDYIMNLVLRYNIQFYYGTVGSFV